MKNLKNTYKFLFVILLFLSFSNGFSTVPIIWNFPDQVLTQKGPGINAREPKLTSDSTGTIIHVTWYRFDGANSIIETTSSYNGGASWSANTALTLTGLNAVKPSIATDETGTIIHVVWKRDTALNGAVIETMTSYDAGRTWDTAGTATILSSTSSATDNAFSPQVITNKTGTKVYTSWARQDISTIPDSYWVEFTQSLDSGVTWPAPAAVTILDNIMQSKGLDSPQLAIDSTGNKVHLVWRKNTGINNLIYTRSTFDAGASWSPPLASPGTLISQALMDSFYPYIATDTTGTKVHSIWYTYNGTNNAIFANTSLDSGTSWAIGGSQLTVTGLNRNAINPRLSTNSSGSIVCAVWSRETDVNDIIESSTSYDSGTTWPSPGTSAQLSAITVAPNHASFPKVETDSIGNKVVSIWFRFNGSSNIVEASNSIDAGRTWLEPNNVSVLSDDITGQNAFWPQVIMNQHGSKVHAIWNRFNGTNLQIETLGGILDLWSFTTSIDLIR